MSQGSHRQHLAAPGDPRQAPRYSRRHRWRDEVPPAVRVPVLQTPSLARTESAATGGLAAQGQLRVMTMHTTHVDQGHNTLVKARTTMCNPNTRIYIHACTHAHTHTGNNAPSSLAESPRTNLRRFFAFACSRARRRAARARAADTLGARSSAASPPSRRVSVATVAMESACSREKQRGRPSRVRGGIKHTLRCAQKMPRTLPASEREACLAVPQVSRVREYLHDPETAARAPVEGSVPLSTLPWPLPSFRRRLSKGSLCSALLARGRSGIPRQPL